MSEHDDFTRHSLVTTFHCASCGRSLTISYQPDKEPSDDLSSSMDHPTGAAMVRNRISVWPCEVCLRPAKDAAKAVSNLLAIAGVKP
jgi:hypothetical protein